MESRLRQQQNRGFLSESPQWTKTNGLVYLLALSGTSASNGDNVPSWCSSLKDLLMVVIFLESRREVVSRKMSFKTCDCCTAVRQNSGAPSLPHHSDRFPRLLTVKNSFTSRFSSIAIYSYISDMLTVKVLDRGRRVRDIPANSEPSFRVYSSYC